MDIGKPIEQPMIVIEPLENPIPKKKETPVETPEEVTVPDEHLVPA